MSSSPLRSLHPPGATQLRGRIPRFAEAAVERARLTVVPRRRDVRRARIPFVSLVSLLLVGGVVGLLLFNTSMQQSSFAATTLEQQARMLDAREQALRSQLEELRDPQRLAQTATRRGMVVPTTPCFLTLGDAATAGVCTPASPDDALPVTPPPVARPAEFDPPPVRVPASTPRDTDASSGPNAGNQGRNGSQQPRQSQGQQQSQQSQQ